MPPVSNEPDELIDHVLEDERTAALQEFRERDEMTIETIDQAASDTLASAELDDKT